MIPNVTLSWPPVIEFGVGTLRTLTRHLQGLRKVYFVCDPAVKHALGGVIDALAKDGAQTHTMSRVVPEPPIDVLKSLLGPTRDFAPDAVVGVGGGSAMDLAKLLAALWPGRQKIEDIIGIGKLEGRTSRLIAIPTTAGTGSEVTPIAVLTDTRQRLKKGVVSTHLTPDAAIVDPELTLALPPALTAATGMDAMTHCIEAYTNRRAHPITDTIALEGIRRIAANLETAVASGHNLAARTAMALGSLCGGMCLGPVNTAAVHAMAYPLGGEFKIAHGVANSILLPFVMNFNLPAVVEKYANVAVAMGADSDAPAETLARQAVLGISDLSKKCGIPSTLAELGIPRSAIPAMARAALKVERLMNNNPRPVTIEHAERIFNNAFDGILQ